MKTLEIQKLIEFIAKLGLQEVNIETEDIKLHIKKSMMHPGETAPPSSSAPLVPQTLPKSEEDVSEPNTNYLMIKSPMIGTFYRSANPDTPPFVKEGDTIHAGTKLCIIEAMKLYNEIESEHSGRIIKILVDNVSPVEYDQPLFLIDPS